MSVPSADFILVHHFLEVSFRENNKNIILDDKFNVQNALNFFNDFKDLSSLIENLFLIGQNIEEDYNIRRAAIIRIRFLIYDHDKRFFCGKEINQLFIDNILHKILQMLNNPSDQILHDNEFIQMVKEFIFFTGIKANNDFFNFIATEANDCIQEYLNKDSAISEISGFFSDLQLSIIKYVILSTPFSYILSGSDFICQELPCYSLSLDLINDGITFYTKILNSPILYQQNMIYFLPFIFQQAAVCLSISFHNIFKAFPQTLNIWFDSIRNLFQNFLYIKKITNTQTHSDIFSYALQFLISITKNHFDLFTPENYDSIFSLIFSIMKMKITSNEIFPEIISYHIAKFIDVLIKTPFSSHFLFEDNNRDFLYSFLLTFFQISEEDFERVNEEEFVHNFFPDHQMTFKEDDYEVDDPKLIIFHSFKSLHEITDFAQNVADFFTIKIIEYLSRYFSFQDNETLNHIYGSVCLFYSVSSNFSFSNTSQNDAMVQFIHNLLTSSNFFDNSFGLILIKSQIEILTKILPPEILMEIISFAFAESNYPMLLKYFASFLVTDILDVFKKNNSRDIFNQCLDLVFSNFQSIFQNILYLILYFHDTDIYLNLTRFIDIFKYHIIISQAFSVPQDIITIFFKFLKDDMENESTSSQSIRCILSSVNKILLASNELITDTSLNNSVNKFCDNLLIMILTNVQPIFQQNSVFFDILDLIANIIFSYPTISHECWPLIFKLFQFIHIQKFFEEIATIICNLILKDPLYLFSHNEITPTDVISLVQVFLQFPGEPILSAIQILTSIIYVCFQQNIDIDQSKIFDISFEIIQTYGLIQTPFSEATGNLFAAIVSKCPERYLSTFLEFYPKQNSSWQYGIKAGGYLAICISLIQKGLHEKFIFEFGRKAIDMIIDPIIDMEEDACLHIEENYSVPSKKMVAFSEEKLICMIKSSVHFKEFVNGILINFPEDDEKLRYVFGK